MSEPPVRILLLEDDPNDEALLRKQLARQGLSCDLRRVDTLEAYARALARETPDVVLADFKLKGFDALPALDQARRDFPELPFILFSGSLQDAEAAELLRRGATDFVLKDCPERLASAIQAAQRAAAGRKATREALELNRQIIQSASVGITVYDRELRYLIWNPVMEELSGIKSSDMIGKHPLEVLPSLKELGIYALLERALRGESVQAGDIQVPGIGGGKPRWTSPRFGPLRNARGEIAGVIGMVQEVTARRQAEEAQAAEARKLGRVLERVSDAFVALDADWRYTYVNQKAAESFGRRPEDLVGKHIWTEFPEGVGQKFHLAYEKALKEQVPLQIEEFYPPSGLWFENRIYPSPDGLSIFFNDVTERKRLEDTRNRLALILEATPDLVGFATAEGKTLFVNAAGRRMLEIPESESLRDVPISSFHPSDEWKLFEKDRLPRALETGLWRGETQFRTRGGRILPATQTLVTHRTPEGRVDFLSTIARDISEEKRAAERIRESEARLRAVFESPMVGIFFWDAEGGVTQANDVFLSLLGYSREELAAGRVDWRKMTPPEHEAADARAFAEVERTGVCTPFEKEYLHKNGTCVPIILGGALLSRSPMKGVSFVLDNTERRHSAEALQRSEAELRRLNAGLEREVQARTHSLRESERTLDLIFNAMNTFVGLLSPDGRVLRTNQAPLEAAGVASSDVIGVPVWDAVWFNYSEESRRHVQGTMARAAAGEASIERYRISAGKNGFLWIDISFKPVRDLEGRVVQILGEGINVTAQLQAEEALELSEEARLRLEETVRQRSSFEGLVGKSAVMQEVYRRLRLAAQSDVPVLVTGESGTGKELVAAAIHGLSPRRSKPFISVNCAAIPEALLESELFGHVKGAFTGAVRDKVGLFQAAEGGTLFLDEVGDMPPSLQVKVLRTLQEHEIRRVGDERTAKVDVRLVTATNRDLPKLLASGGMREDFYYRIRVFEIALPPLRQRREDIPLLIAHFLDQFARTHKRRLKGAAPEALRQLLGHPWPGNIRELRNALEHALVTATKDQIRPEDLPSDIQKSRPEAPPPDLDSEERRRIIAAVKESGGSRKAAALLLGFSRVTLWKKFRKWAIREEELS